MNPSCPPQPGVDEIAASPVGDEALHCWSRTEPPLANLAHLADLLATARSTPSAHPGGLVALDGSRAERRLRAAVYWRGWAESAGPG